MPLARNTCTGWLVLLFLMSSTAHSPLASVNPWLSSCDLHQPSPDLQGPCADRTMISEFPGPPPPRCPPPCSSTSRNSDNTTQCLEYLNESHKTVLCGAGAGSGLATRLRLRHCCEHSVHSSLGADLWSDNATCERAVQALIDTDRLAASLECAFSEVLSRYDCGQSYSVNFHCSHCQEAYRQWVCASLVPHWLHGRHRVKPCRSVCQRVEQKCPFFLPGDRAPSYPTQYAGEPTFLCLDPNIPETGEQSRRSTYSSTCCFEPCAGNLCMTPATCTPDYPEQLAQTCASATAPILSQCTSGAPRARLSIALFALLLGHLIDRRCRKRTKISWK
ncbi:NALCN channel auxiliary factor 1 [Macrosteles quadrilineatus]|uniref:NALCN channel auxiliary factor 1 n=1 Tax=Macrosteles quadrilineatus TaxID=74068 RepID=UPI0023E0B5FF|nr:NALCN channel auxiliary factor 1 [Macrosteles quadrilineatus]XP_054270474.1 NALCN channel auxiliary factor 1 [Macrosteles quadrilineatus]XP_054270475.1 NALCN channel auxiliary factor 1 [Macrosteles quadrilineatus]